MDKQYVLNIAKLKGFDLFLPTKNNPGILAMDCKKDKNGIHRCIIDAQNWKEAKEQLQKYYGLGAWVG